MEAQMGAPDFWDNNDRAQKHIAKLNGLKRAVNPVVAFRKKVDDLGVLLEFAEMAEGAEQEEYEKELETTTNAMVTELDALEIDRVIEIRRPLRFRVVIRQCALGIHSWSGWRALDRPQG